MTTKNTKARSQHYCKRLFRHTIPYLTFGIGIAILIANVGCDKSHIDSLSKATFNWLKGIASALESLFILVEKYRPDAVEQPRAIIESLSQCVKHVLRWSYNISASVGKFFLHWRVNLLCGLIKKRNESTSTALSILSHKTTNTPTSVTDTINCGLHAIHRGLSNAFWAIFAGVVDGRGYAVKNERCHGRISSESGNPPFFADVTDNYRVARTRNPSCIAKQAVKDITIIQDCSREYDNEYIAISGKSTLQGVNDNTCEIQRSGDPHPGMILDVASSADGLSFENMVLYELTEKIEGELGLVDIHALDYAYQPVIDRKPSKENGVKGEDNAVDKSLLCVPDTRHKALANCDKEPNALKSERIEHNFGKELLYDFPRTILESNADKSKFYQTVGERAFAGGSHGEIWRARRRCDVYVPSKSDDSHRYTSRTLFPGEDGEGHRKVTECDENQALIMKRLRIEQGRDLLEAGLREVYFGQLLAREEPSGILFSKYVDHFFRRRTIKPGHGSSYEELWIVLENGGPSLRSYLYTPIFSEGFLMYQNSDYWRELRRGVVKQFPRQNRYKLNALIIPEEAQTEKHEPYQYSTSNDRMQFQHASNMSKTEKIASEGRRLLRDVLRQLLASVAFLHEYGIVHRDIKPSNILCKTSFDFPFVGDLQSFVLETSARCVLADFSSAWSEAVAQRMYSSGPSAAEQTDEYAPPEVLFGAKWIAFDKEYPQSYDSWSVGVVALELLLGTPHVFSVDQRTTSVLTSRMKRSGATDEDIKKALYLAALSQFCIYMPSGPDSKGWPWRTGDPLHLTPTARPTCTLHDFHSALRARDPLGLGFDSSTDSLLSLISQLLAWNPKDRILPKEALKHRYFSLDDYSEEEKGKRNNDAMVSRPIEPGPLKKEIAVQEFACPKCLKIFRDYGSCHAHANSRRHAKFCVYDESLLPPCISSHSMLPAHATSGYCDIQGRRPSIEDFHSIHLHPSHQFFGVFDGHHGNLASKYAASQLYPELSKRLVNFHEGVVNGTHWRDEIEREVAEAFQRVHDGFLRVAATSPGRVMDESGTTASVVYVTHDAIIVANIGDSRAILTHRNSTTSVGENVEIFSLTVDHTPSDPHEKKKIVTVGGFVSSVGGIDRVNGVLAVSRSIGDATLSPFLSRRPHVTIMTRSDIDNHCYGNRAKSADEQTPCFIVLASDGLWDVMNNQEVMNLVIHCLNAPSSGFRREERGVLQEAAQRLTHEAYVRGSRDNIGVCLIAAGKFLNEDNGPHVNMDFPPIRSLERN